MRTYKERGSAHAGLIETVNLTFPTHYGGDQSPRSGFGWASYDRSGGTKV